MVNFSRTAERREQQWRWYLPTAFCTLIALCFVCYSLRFSLRRICLTSQHQNDTLVQSTIEQTPTLNTSILDTIPRRQTATILKNTRRLQCTPSSHRLKRPGLLRRTMNVVLDELHLLMSGKIHQHQSPTENRTQSNTTQHVSAYVKRK